MARKIKVMMTDSEVKITIRALVDLRNTLLNRGIDTEDVNRLLLMLTK